MILDKLFIPLPSLHPLFFVTLAFMAGICWQAGTCSPVMLVALITGILAYLYYSAQTGESWYMLGAALGLSFYGGSFILQHQQNEFSTWLSKTQHPVDVIGTVTDICSSPTKNYPYLITIKIEKVHSTNYTDAADWGIQPYYLMVYTQRRPQLWVQDRIFLSSIKISSPNKESWQRYALKQRIGGTLFCKKCMYTTVSRPTWSWNRWLWNIRQKLARQLLGKMSHLSATFYALLFMGTHHQNKKNSDALRSPFQTWGILHYLARSGLHLVICIMIWSILLLVVPCTQRIREVLLFLLSCIYFLLSWPTLSFVRAFATYILYKIGSFYAKPSHTLHILSLVTLLFLVVNPIYVFCLDFQLSFGLTCALAWAQSNNALSDSSTNS